MANQTKEKEILQNFNGPSSHQKIESLQRELHLVQHQLILMTKARKSTDESELEHHLFEKKIILQLKLKRWKEVVEDGYKILGKKGPSVIVYKCILVGLCRLGRYEEEVSDLLDVWWRATPKCRHMQQCREKMTYYLNAIKSGLEPEELFKNLEEALGLNADWVVKGEINGNAENGNGQSTINGTKIVENHHWKFRPPPLTDAPYYLCPRGETSCMYGDTCVAAHWKEELDEWNSKRAGLGCNTPNKYIEEKQKMVTEIQKTDVNGKLPELSSAVNLLKELPSFAFHYLVEINKRIKETKNIRVLFAEEIPNVKFICKSPLNITKKIPIADLGSSSVETTWSFVLSTKAPMRNVCLLEDCHRECFRITTGKFISASKTSVNLIDLHDMNALQDSKSGVQVLNSFIPLPILYQIAGNWPDWFFYKIEVTFRQPPLKYGTFVQSVMFDMKYDPKLIKHLSVHVTPEENKQIVNSQESNGTSSLKNGQLITNTQIRCTEIENHDNNTVLNKRGLFDEGIETNGYGNPKYGHSANKLPMPSTSKITNGYNIDFRKEHYSSMSNISTLKGKMTNGYAFTKQPEKNRELFRENMPMENTIVKSTISINGHNGIANSHVKNPYDNISKELNPSQFMQNSVYKFNKVHTDKQPNIDDSMPSLYEQNAELYHGLDSSRGSNFSLRSDSPLSNCTISSSSSGSGEPSQLKVSNDQIEFPNLVPSKSQKESEWLKVQKSNKKTKYVPESDSQELPKQELNPMGLSTETKIGFLLEMGFDRRSAIKALQNCDKDFERSVEWLISGEEKRYGYNKPGK